MKKILLLMMGLFIFSLGLFAEIPHSYVTENPDKEVTQTETLKKYKEKAELNLSVTKLNSEEIEGIHDPEQKKIFFTLENSIYEIQPGDHIYVSEELQEVPSISTTNGRRKINGLLSQEEKDILKEGALEYKVIKEEKITKIEISYEKVPQTIYIGILDSQYKIKKILKDLQVANFKLTRDNTNETVRVYIKSTYNGEFFEATPTLSSTENPNLFGPGYDPDWFSGPNITFLEFPDLMALHNDPKLYGADSLISISINNQKVNGSGLDYPKKIFNLSDDLVIETGQKYGELWIKGQSYNQLMIRFIKYPKNKRFSFTIKQDYYDNRASYTRRFTKIVNYNFIPHPAKFYGKSHLFIDNTYKNEYISFNPFDMEKPEPISLEKPVTGVKLVSISGYGFPIGVNEKIEINGKQLDTSFPEEAEVDLPGINFTLRPVDFWNEKFKIKINSYDPNKSYKLVFKIIINTTETAEHTMIINPMNEQLEGTSNLTVDETYNQEYIPFTSCTIENQEDIGLEKTITGVTLSQTSGKGLITLQQNDILEVNGKQYVVGTGGSLTEQSDTLGKINYSFKAENGKLRLRVDKYGLQINTAQPLSLKVTRDGKEVMTHTMNIKVPYVEKIIGESVLEVKEYYPSPEYIAFNSCSLNSPIDIDLENSLRDVKLTQTSGKGLVKLEQGDTLEINGKNYIIGAGGNLPEQSDTLGNINFKFKVENGKIRLALISWGVLEPDRLLTINAKRSTPIMEHKMTIKAPRRVEGTSTLKFTEKYPIRDIVRFQGISLTAPNIGGIEPPIPAGVSYKSNDGYGIPFMKEGDILEVQCETMRATQKYIIDSKNSLKHQTIDLPGTVLSLLVEDGKLRLGLNNWLVNKNTVLNFRVIRGVNEISNTSITLEVPKAPFDILKNGILDFGKLIQGSKNKKAETSILLEMHQDISNVKFSLSTTTPELVNSSGATLQARDLQAGVQKQGKKRHLVRIIGRLDVPEKQELGVYRGSVLLNVTIK